MPIGFIYVKQKSIYQHQEIGSILSIRSYFFFLIILYNNILVTDTQRNTCEFNLRYNTRHSFSVRRAFKPRIYAHKLCVNALRTIRRDDRRSQSSDKHAKLRSREIFNKTLHNTLSANLLMMQFFAIMFAILLLFLLGTKEQRRVHFAH